MILYQLLCEEDHTFEAWFRDSTAYDAQARDGHVECPYCGSTKVAKAPMAPHIASSHGDDAHETGRETGRETGPKTEPKTEMDAETAASHERASEVAQQILNAVGQIRDYAEQNLENVGEDFADEARKIHAGEAEERGIYGRATDDEAHELEEEGVEFVRLPGSSRRNS